MEGCQKGIYTQASKRRQEPYLQHMNFSMTETQGKYYYCQMQSQEPSTI